MDEQVLDRISEVVSSIAVRYPVSRVYLFGSRARGTANEDSDYDFCVCPDTGCTLTRVGAMLMDLREAFSADVDIAFENDEDTPFQRSMREERVLLYDKSKQTKRAQPGNA